MPSKMPLGNTWSPEVWSIIPVALLVALPVAAWLTRCHGCFRTQEDQRLAELVDLHGQKKWSQIATDLGTNKGSKQVCSPVSRPNAVCH